MSTFNVNGRKVSVSAEPDKPLLWVLREDLGLSVLNVRRKRMKQITRSRGVAGGH